MSSKTLIWILWIASIVFIALTFFSYILQFGDNGLSKDTEVWGQFGDYFGGILNPFLSLLNLIILTYLSVRLVKEEDERNKWTLQELARPYGEIDFDKNLSELEISIHNYGLGPMIINDISIFNENKSYTNFSDLMRNIEFSTLNQSTFAMIRTFRVSNNHSTIGKDNNVTLLKIIPQEGTNNEEYRRFFDFIKIELSKFNIKIVYSDMYKRKMDEIIEKIDFIY